MKTSLQVMRLVVAAMTALGFTTTAAAVPISLTLADDYYLGSIDDGVASSDANELSWVNLLARMLPTATEAAAPDETLTRSSNDFGFANPATSMPLATAGTKTDPAGRTYTVLSDSLYLLGKYGKGQGTSQFSHVWYIGGILPGKQVTLPSLEDDDMLSHDTLFSGTRVPDGGTSTLLLGVAFMLLGASRRFFRA